MPQEKNTFYITTPIYYPSSDLHIGHTYTTVAADAMKRLKQMQGYDAYLLTGTDEHGLKIQKAAAEAGVSPQEFVNEKVDGIKKLWELMNIDYDQFIRTTDPEHVKTIQEIFKKLYDQGDIYKGKYEGHYCTPCESFWTESQLVDGKCPDCGREVTTESEEAYFFKMSKYADRLMDYIEKHPDFIQPVSRKNEMIENFLKPGLQDLCVSRTTFDWGVPVSFDEDHVVYVWMDALPNYISALGYENGKDDLMDKYWPADVHLVGKDIIRFHTIYWPIFLMALDLPIPEKVYGHGWILIQGDKMSKSVGNVIDPASLAEKYGVDALRYYILSDMKAGLDGNYSEKLLVKRINEDLANDFGNLVSRTVAMTVKYFDGEIPTARQNSMLDSEFVDFARQIPRRVSDAMDRMDPATALEEIWRLINRSNKYIDETEPWQLAKDQKNAERVANVLYNLTESLRYVGILLAPFMPETSEKLLDQLKVPQNLRRWDTMKYFGAYPNGIKVERSPALFPRIDMSDFERKESRDELKERAKKSLVNQTEGAEDYVALATEVLNAGAKAQNKDLPLKESDKKWEPRSEEEEVVETVSAPAQTEAVAETQTTEELASAEAISEETPETEQRDDGLIDIEDFGKVKLKVGKIIECVKHPNADRLLLSKIDVGGEVRQIVSGIAEYYNPEDMVGKEVVVVTNLAPATIRGEVSEGMILAAEDGDTLSLLTADKELNAGSDIK